MSEAQAQFVPDAYLASQVKPPQPPGCMVYDPQWKNLTFLTPVGRLLNCSLDKPAVFTPKGGLRQGEQPAAPKYSLTLAFHKDNALVGDIYNAIAAVATGANTNGVERADPNNLSKIIRYQGLNDISAEHLAITRLFFAPTPDNARFWFPLQDGDLKYAEDPKQNAHYRNTWYINATMYPTTQKGTPVAPVLQMHDGSMCTDPRQFERGDYARAMFRAKWYDNNGSKGVSIQIVSVQHAGKGERILGGGFDAQGAARAAFAFAGPIPVNPAAIRQPDQSGPMGGFAQPQAQPAQNGFAQPASPATQQPIPPQQPQQPAAPNWNPPQVGGAPFAPPGGARPAGFG